MVEDNFRLFLSQTGELPELNENELKSIGQYISLNYYERLSILKDAFFEELAINNISTANDKQLKGYLNYMLDRLKPISNCLFKASFIQEIEEKELYLIPQSLVNNDNSNERIETIQKLHEEAIQRMQVYTHKETKLFKLLTEVFNQNYWSYEVIAEVEQEIKFVMIDRGLITEKEAFGSTNTHSKLSATEIALKHWYLEEARVEKSINGSQVGNKYKHLASKSNIEKAYNNFANKRKKPTIMQLKNIMNDLSDYPNVQKAIANDIAKLN